jgi:hypothetical protein
MDRTPGAADIHIHDIHSPLKVYLILVFGLVIVAVAFGGRTWGTQARSSATTQPTYGPPIYVVMTVEVDKPVTITPTPTRTMMPFELTVAAKPTETPHAYWSPTPLPTRRPTIVPTSTPWTNKAADAGSETGT